MHKKNLNRFKIWICIFRERDGDFQMLIYGICDKLNQPDRKFHMAHALNLG